MGQRKIINTVMTGIISIGVAATSTHAMAKSKCPVEKCYGIAKASKNECGTPKHACAAQSKINNAPNDWIYVMKGNCKLIAGGQLKSPQERAGTKK